MVWIIETTNKFTKIWRFISYPLPYDLSCEDDLGYLYSPGKYSLILIVLWQLIFTLVVEYFCSSSYWLLRWIDLFIAFLAFCMDPNFQLVVVSVVNKIWRVMIPCVCILYSNTNIKDNAWILGEHSFLFTTLSYLSIFDPFNWHLILYLMFWYLQLVLIGIQYLLHRYLFQLIFIVGVFDTLLLFFTLLDSGQVLSSSWYLFS